MKSVNASTAWCFAMRTKIQNQFNINQNSRRGVVVIASGFGANGQVFGIPLKHHRHSPRGASAIKSATLLQLKSGVKASV